MGLALRFRGIRLEHFADDRRRDPAFRAIAAKLHVSASPETDRLYPQLRPARVNGNDATRHFHPRVPTRRSGLASFRSKTPACMRNLPISSVPCCRPSARRSLPSSCGTSKPATISVRSWKQAAK